MASLGVIKNNGKYEFSKNGAMIYNEVDDTIYIKIDGEWVAWEVAGLAVPDGKTVLPTDDVVIWQQCAGIANPIYTTLADVLADTSILSILMASDNAVDYLVRSTTFASDVCADANAMTYIGQNNYASNTLLEDLTWCTAICNSAYFESVLNVKVPILSSDDGHVIGTNPSYRVFDGTSSYAETQTPWTVGYDFQTQYKFYKSYVKTQVYRGYIMAKNYKIRGSNDNSTWTDIESGLFVSQSQLEQTKTFNNANYRYMQVLVLDTYYQDSNAGDLTNVQFYGREDV